MSANSGLLHTNSCPMCRAIIHIPSPAHVLRTVIDQMQPYTSVENHDTFVNKQLQNLAQNYLKPPPSRQDWTQSVVALSGEHNYRAAQPPSEVVWEGVFEEELECCDGCGGMAKNGECLGYAGVHGRDGVFGFQIGNGTQFERQVPIEPTAGMQMADTIDNLAQALRESHQRHVQNLRAHAQALQQLEGIAAQQN